MTTNKDFKEFQKFLAEKNQEQIDEGAVSKVINTGITGYMGYETGSAIKDKRYGDAVSSGLSMMPGPVGWAAVASDAIGKAAKTEKGKAQGEWVRKNVPGAETVANYMRKAGEAIGIREPSKPQEPETPKEPEIAKAPEAPETPKASETPKPINTDISKSLTPDYSSYAKGKQFKTSDEESGGKKKMSDKKKSISEALAEVQRLQEENFLKEVFEILEKDGIDINEHYDYLEEAGIFDVIRLGGKAAKYAGHKALDAANYIKGQITGRGSTVYRDPSGFQFRRANPPKPPVQGPPAPVPTPAAPKTSLGTKVARAGVVGLGLAAGNEALKGLGVIGAKSGEESKAEAPSGDAATPAETPKTETPKTSPETKQSFKQAFAAARKAAAEKGAKATGQFEYSGKKYQTNLAPAKGAEKYVSMGKQTKVGVPSPKAETPKPEAPKANTAAAPAPKTTSLPAMASPETAQPMRMPKSIGGETEKAPGFQIKMPWDTESGGKSKGKQKMSEEHIDEMTPFEKTFAQKMKQLGPGKTYRDPGTGKDILLKYGQNKPKAPGQSVPKAAGPKGPQDNPGLRSANPQFLRPRPDKSLSSISPGRDPAKIDYSKNNQGKPETLPSTTRDSAEDPARGVQRLPGGGEKGVGTPGGTLSLERPAQTPKVSSPSDSGLVSNRPRPGQEAPGAAASDFVRRELGQSPMKSDSSPPPASTPSSSIPPSMKVPASMSGSGSAKDVVGSPTSRFGFGSVSSVGRTESGGKKKMKESTGNPFIDSFLELQNTKAGNVFEAAKKLSDKQKKIASLAGHPDKIDAEDFKALRAGKKMEEADNSDSADYLGAGAVTSTPAKAAKPAAPKKVMGDPSYQGSGEVTKDNKPTRVKEEVTFSDEEIAHINSVIEAFAPEAPEENMSDGVSKKMDRKTLTDSKKVK